MKMKQHNITLSQTFNDFALQTEDIEYGVEDLVSYCIENTSVFYWLNIESVWGPVGFQWDSYENKGHFEVNPVKFNVLPRIPDPHRLHSFQDIFKNFRSSGQMTILHNKWENIDTLGNWNHPDVIIHVEPDNGFKYIDDSNQGSYQDKVTISGGTYKNIQNIGNRAFGYIGEVMEMPLLTLFKDYPDYTNNKYKYMRLFVDGDIDSLCAEDIILNNQDWEFYIEDEFIPSISLNGSPVSLKADLRPVVLSNGKKAWHTLFSNLGNCNDVTINNVISTKSHPHVSNSDMDNMYMIVHVGDIGKFDSNTFLYEGEEFNKPILYSGVDITLNELRNIPEKYNLFTNANHKCRYYRWAQAVSNPGNSTGLNIAALNTEPILGKWLSNTKITEFDKAIDLTVNAHTLYNNTVNHSSCSLKVAPPTGQIINSYDSSALDKIKPLTQTDSWFTLSTNNAEYNVLLDNINYIDTEVEGQVKLLENCISNEGKGNIALMLLNDSISKTGDVSFSGKSVVLSKDLESVYSADKLILLEGQNFKLKYKGNKNLNFKNIDVPSDIIPEFMEIPPLKMPINDPENYEYNHKIVQQYGLMYQDQDLVAGPAKDAKVVNRQPYFLWRDKFRSYGLYMINTFSYQKFSNTFKSIVDAQQRLVQMRNTDLIAVDYPQNLSFYHSYWFTDESDDSNQTALKTLKKEKMDEFLDKVMLNPSYKGTRDKSILTFSSEQYALIDPARRELLIDYGYAIEERTH